MIVLKGVGVTVRVGVTLGVGVWLGVTVGVGVGVILGVGVTLDVGVWVGVAVGRTAPQALASSARMNSDDQSDTGGPGTVTRTARTSFLSLQSKCLMRAMSPLTSSGFSQLTSIPKRIEVSPLLTFRN